MVLDFVVYMRKKYIMSKKLLLHHSLFLITYQVFYPGVWGLQRIFDGLVNLSIFSFTQFLIK